MKANKKQMPSLRSDEEAEKFVAQADLSDYDLSGFKSVRIDLRSRSVVLDQRSPSRDIACVDVGLKQASKHTGHR